MKKHRHHGKRSRKPGTPICPCCEENFCNRGIGLEDGLFIDKTSSTERHEGLQELEKFEEMLGKYPLDKIADWFGLSRQAIRKQCRELGIHPHFPEMDYQPNAKERQT